MRYLSIGEMAKVNGLSTRALRVYQDKGILSPAHVDEKTGARFYDIRQSRIIDAVQTLQSVGFSLEEIKQVCDSHNIDRLEQATLAHIEDIRDQRRRLEAAEHAAREIVDSCRLYRGESIIKDNFFLQRLPQRRIIRFDLPSQLDFRHDGTETENQWEWMLRRVKRTILSKGLPPTLYRNVCCAVSRERVAQNNPSISYAFVFVDESHGSCYEEAEIIPAGDFLTYYADQGYMPDGTGACAHLMGHVLEYASAKRLEPVGDYYEEVMCRWPCMFGENGSMLFRVCLPVRAARQ